METNFPAITTLEDWKLEGEQYETFANIAMEVEQEIMRLRDRVNYLQRYHAQVTELMES